jgi:hypothetical protein
MGACLWMVVLGRAVGTPYEDRKLKIVIEMPDSDRLIFDSEDSGQAKISEVSGSVYLDGKEVQSDTDGLFVRIQSWDSTKKHKLMKMLAGKKVRVIIEEVE